MTRFCVIEWLVQWCSWGKGAWGTTSRSATTTPNLEVVHPMPSAFPWEQAAFGLLALRRPSGSQRQSLPVFGQKAEVIILGLLWARKDALGFPSTQKTLLGHPPPPPFEKKVHSPRGRRGATVVQPQPRAGRARFCHTSCPGAPEQLPLLKPPQLHYWISEGSLNLCSKFFSNQHNSPFRSLWTLF